MSTLGFLTGQAGRDQDAADQAQQDALGILYQGGPSLEETSLSEGLYGDPESGRIGIRGEGRSAQLAALRDISRAAGGFGSEEEAARIRQEQGQLGAMAAGAQGAQQQHISETGTGGGYAAQVAGVQARGEAMGDLRTQQAAGARMRALQAMQDQAQLASEYRGQGYDERNQQASAVDAFNQANTARRRDVRNADTNRQNERLGQIVDARMGNAMRSEQQSIANQQSGSRIASGITSAAGQAASRDRDTSGSNTYSGWKS